MKKTFLSVALLSTMALSMPLSFTSCKDYDDDITEINGTTDDLQNQLKTIQAAIDSNKAIADAAKAAADASAKAAQEAADKGDKATEEAQKAMAIAKAAEAAAANAKAEALEEMKALLAQADAKNEQEIKDIKSRLEGVEKGLGGLDADQINTAIKAVEAIQVQLKAFEGYKALLDQLAAYPALIQDVKDAKANIESLTTRVEAAEKSIEALEKLSQAINDSLPAGVNTIAGVIAQRLTSVTLIPDLYVGGIPTIAFESAKYNNMLLVDGEWKVTADSKTYAIHNGETTAQYRLNPGNVGAEDVVMDELGFVSKIAVSRADEAINDVVAYVPGSGKVDANGILTVNLTKPVSNSASLNLPDNRIYTVSLRVPIAKKHLFTNEGAAFVYSEYTRLEETYFQPQLFATPKVLEAAGAHFADSTTIYNSAVQKMVGYQLCYKDQLDLNKLVQGCAFVAPDSHTPMTLKKLKSYGFDVVFSIAKGEYKPNTVDKTNQQAFAKLDGTTLTPIVPTGGGDNQACIGKEPIIHILLVDTKNKTADGKNTVADSRYVKIQYTKEKMTPLPFTVATFNENLSCKDSYVFTVGWEQMMENALSKYPTNGISKHDFLAIYGKHASEKVVTVDGVENTTLVNNITDYVELGDNDQATPVMSFTLTNAEIGALAQTKTKAYVVTLTYTDPKGLNPDVVITFNVNITNNIASPTLGKTDATKWVNETMLLYPIPYGTGVTVANYNTNILQGRSNPLVDGLLPCGEWSFNLTGTGSDVATMKVKAGSLVENALGLWMSNAMAENLTETYVAIPNDAKGIALVEAETKLTVTWKARLNGLAANTVNFGTSYLKIVKPLKDPELESGQKFVDNSSAQKLPKTLMQLLTLKDAYNQTVANTSGMPKNLWNYYDVKNVKFGNIDKDHQMMITDLNKQNARSLASLHMTANISATTELTFKNEGAPLQNDCLLEIPVMISHRWGVLEGKLYVKIEHVLSQN
ncbi:MAG: hypothetical protein J6L79_01390 [Muribaculaceae bacterium]|nr:hypothetical protein [Muribaculaceae bacterium]